MNEDIYGIGFSDIMGAQAGGGQELQDVINSLYGVLREGGYFGTEARKDKTTLAGLEHPSGSTPYGYEEEDWGKTLKDITSQTNMDYYADLKSPTDPQKGVGSLLSLLGGEGVKMGSLTKDYTQDVGDVNAEIGAQLQELIKGSRVGAKSGRYGGIASGGRNIGTGGRSKYMSDYYGLKEKQFNMQEDLQKGVVDDFNENIGQWMSIHPYVEE